jgi:hypothetical protein
MSSTQVHTNTTALHPLIKLIFSGFLLFSLYHLVRDVVQIMGMQHPVFDVLHIPHAWCGNGCDWVTIPLDLVGVVGSGIILQRQVVGKWALVLIATMIMWFVFMWLP